MRDSMPATIEILRPIAKPVPETPPDDSLRSEPATWWHRYGRAIARLPIDTVRVMEEDARYIADQAVPRDGLHLDIDAFGPHRVRTGIVVGSVQSGKTANMLAVAALLLDDGADILIVLAGTRVALWLQTYERLLKQLDGTDMHSAWSRNSRRVLIPQPEDILASDDRVDPVQYLRGARRRVKNAIVVGTPLIFVVPKEDDHLLALARFLSEHTSVVGASDWHRPLSMVVLDDEADDASILDARDGSKITPKFIEHLWSSDAVAPATRHNNIFASYIAYTATPQANYLQLSHNPLAPRSFHAALRTPSDRGAHFPRAATYTERRGLSSYYTGGDMFYERLRELPGDPCVAFPFPEVVTSEDEATLPVRHAVVRWQMIGDALRSYFVAGAIRLLLDEKRLSDIPAEPVERAKLISVLPSPHCMLYHPSVLKEEHFSGAEDLVRWTRALPGFEAEEELPANEFGDPLLSIDVMGLSRRLELEVDSWSAWLTSFKATAAGLASLPGAATESIGLVAWDDVRKTLVEEIFPNVRLRVLNSDPRADDRPNFEPSPVGSDGIRLLAPRDVFTIFVAGNVLSRGLTVEGLCTSLFLRSAREPSADTQMQMQRWFGYRGNHLAFCRIFIFRDQLELFRQYHRNDIALKSEILSHMDGHTTPFVDGVLVLQGHAFKATGKVDSRRVPLHPGPTPAVRLVEPPSGDCYNANIELVNELLFDGDWQSLSYPMGVERGLIRTSPVSMTRIATILERLRYSTHDPDVRLDVSQRWASLQKLLRLEEPFFRPPGRHPGPMAVDPSGCPYSIAAYLRLWNTALTRHDLPGMQPTDNPTMPWNMLNLTAYRATEPAFYIGMRFGSEGLTHRLRHGGRSLPMMRRGLSASRNSILETLWGSRNPTERWKGDQVFDYHFHAPQHAPHLLTDGSWRKRGQPGLLLFHPVIEPRTGLEMIAVGLAIPHGGPDHVAALRVVGDPK